jgi:hypothetical protein
MHPTTPDRLRLSIAGTTIALTGHGCLVEPGPEPEFAPFRLPDPHPASDLEFAIHPRGAPPVPEGPPLFSTNAWDLWRQPGGGYRVALIREPGERRPVLTADRLTTRVDYHEAEGRARLGPALPVVFDPFRMPVDQLLFIHHLAHREGFLLHAAGFTIGDVGVVVPGRSGAGKSTLSGLVAATVPEATILSDERMVVRGRDGAFEAWGTPWMGTARVARNQGAPLRALLFPVKDGSHRLSSLPGRVAVRRLLGTAACPHFDLERSAFVLATLERLVASVPAFELRFARDAGVAPVVRDLLYRELRAA